MTRKLSFAVLALAIVSILLVGMILFGQGASAGAGAGGGAMAAVAARANAGTRPSGVGATAPRPQTPSSPDGIAYPAQEDFEAGDFNVNVFYSAAPTCVPGGCGWFISTSSPHGGSFAGFAPEQNNVSDEQLIEAWS